tara:strand:+ start:152 stop:676 length:525 start_codon:yes stop_codon:yes gene_type:complete
MKSKKNIVFLGMMGSGKSSIGSLISKKLGMEFFDIDQTIEKELKMKISEIFKIKGENYFRKFEEKISLEILKKKSIVIALGGGTFLNKNIRKVILNDHLSFWLKLNSNEIIKRIKNNPKRPIAFKSTNNDLFKLIKKRSNIYSKALYKINCNNLTKIETVNKILNLYEREKINN